MKFNFKENNFDLLRLFFALQVVVMHALIWTNTEEQIKYSFLNFLSYLPGVPAFFFVSGFLIYASYEKSASTLNYFKNRLFRLWPGLIFATLGGLFVIILGQYNVGNSGDLYEYFLWFLSQITIGQGWNPDAFRSIGIGVINGALWTITVEILFYISIPIIFWLQRKFKYTVHFLLFVSFIFYCFGDIIFANLILGSKNFNDYLTLTPVIWGWMFMFGSLAYKNLNYLEKYFNYLILGLPIMLVCIFSDFSFQLIFGSEGNRLGILYFIAFCALIIFIGFNKRFLHLKFDISYGVYIWHCVLINFFIIIDYYSILNIIIATICLASVSWVYIESPMLRKKSSSIRN